MSLEAKRLRCERAPPCPLALLLALLQITSFLPFDSLRPTGSATYTRECSAIPCYSCCTLFAVSALVQLAACRRISLVSLKCTLAVTEHGQRYMQELRVLGCWVTKLQIAAKSGQLRARRRPVY